MTTTATPTRKPCLLIAKCHAVRGMIDMGRWVATTPGASVRGNCWLICPCGQPGFAKGIDVKHVPGRVCAERCMAATGPACSCSCGGEGHGTHGEY